jgi:anionic cell wall polymer biosynthesis LytR-Cps2A-Psr (LCP) family protein
MVNFEITPPQPLYSPYNRYKKRGGTIMFGIITVVLIFSIPIIAIPTSHFEKQSKNKHKMLQVELELEKLKHENFLMETEKIRLELDQMKYEQKRDEPRLL